MSKLLCWLVVGALATILMGASICRPALLSDSGNAFLREFVGPELLSFLGVVVTITLASAANLHLELNKLEDSAGIPFPKTRRSIRLSAYSLIGMLALGLVVVFTKNFIGGSDLLSALLNSLSILIVVFGIFVLIDLTAAILRIPPPSAVKKNSSTADRV